MEGEINIPLLILVGCLGMLILAVAIVLFVLLYQKKVLAQQNQLQQAENLHQRQLLEAAIMVEEKERERIAKNIHDDVGMLLNVTKLNLTKISRNIDKKQIIQEVVFESLTLVDETINNIRGIAKDLVPPTLLRLGYLNGIAELSRTISATGEVKVNFTCNEMDFRFKENVELQLYRLTVELVNNILKHAKASIINIQVLSSPKLINIAITHNGVGISDDDVLRISQEQRGIGLKSIESRAQLIDAIVHYYKQPDSKITIDVPTHQKKD